MSQRKKHRKHTRRRIEPPAPPPRKPFWRQRWLFVVVAVVATGVAVWAARRPAQKATAAAASAAKSLYPSLTELVAMTPDQLAQVDIALMNFRCAEGLPGSEGLDVAASLKKLDEYAKRVEFETTRHLYRFRKTPAEYKNSEAYFRLMMMAIVLQDDFGVRYSPKRIEPLDNFQPDEVFAADSKDVFLHGLTGSHMMGTCASLPVLYVAVGRRLGYPLYLSTTKHHLFVRWEDSRTRLNMEATTQGFASYEDDYYKTWPFKITDENIKAEGYLKTMTPSEELACFLMMRGPCLRNVKRYGETLAAYREACRLAPHVRTHQRTRDANEREIGQEMAELRMRQIEQVNWLLDRETIPNMPPPGKLYKPGTKR